MADLRLLVVDPHRAFADALAGRLAREPGLALVGTGQSGDQALRLTAALHPDVVTLEVEPLTAREAGALVRDLVTLEAHVVVLSHGDDPGLVAELAHAGVRCWVSKDAALQDVLDAVRGAPLGEGRMPPRLLGPVLARLTAAPEVGADTELLKRLTVRERDVLRCLLDGMDRSSLSAALYLSENTVRTHVQNIRRKLGVRSSLEAVAVARRAGVRPWTSSP